MLNESVLTKIIFSALAIVALSLFVGGFSSGVNNLLTGTLAHGDTESEQILVVPTTKPQTAPSFPKSSSAILPQVAGVSTTQNAAPIVLGASVIADDHYYVRPVYFVASDETPTDPDWEAKLQTDWIFIRRFFAEEMQRNGFGYREFNMELESNGRPKIYFYRGKNNLAHYAATHDYMDELVPIFGDKSLVVVMARNAPWTGGSNPNSGARNGGAYVGDADATKPGTFEFDYLRYLATSVEGQMAIFKDNTIPSNPPDAAAGWTTASIASARIGGTAHELGHAFGASHGAIGSEFMSFGFYGFSNHFIGANGPIISPGNALIFNNSVYFNSPNTIYTDSANPVIDLKIPMTLPGNTIRVNISGSDNESGPAFLGLAHDWIMYDYMDLRSNPVGSFSYQRDVILPKTLPVGFYNMDAFVLDKTALRTYKSTPFVVVSSLPAIPPTPSLDPNEIVYIDDEVPSAANIVGPWFWYSEIKASGEKSIYIVDKSGNIDKTFFLNASTKLQVSSEDSLVAYIYIPSGGQVDMVAFRMYVVGSSWTKTVYWGEDKTVQWNGDPPNRIRMGDLPTRGGWARLTVPATLVGINNQLVEGFAITSYGTGNVFIDRIGKINGADVVLPPGPDTTPPTVSLTAPGAGSTVSGTAVTISATASDNIGVVGVTFFVDGVAVGAEDASSPYTTTWNTTLSTNASHTLTARARDAAGNQTISAGVNVNSVAQSHSVKLSGIVYNNKVALKWESSGGSGGIVERSRSIDFRDSIKKIENGNIHIDEGLGLGTWYYRVQAGVKGSSDLKMSNIIALTTEGIEPRVFQENLIVRCPQIPITKDLYMAPFEQGSRANEIKSLQEFLWQYRGNYEWGLGKLNHEDFVVGAYRGRTLEAVKGFQDEFMQLEPRSFEYGKVLSATRKKIVEQCRSSFPKAPTNLIADKFQNGTFTSVALYWTDNASNEANYYIERSTSSTFPATQTATTTLGANAQYMSDSISNFSQNYYYRVVAGNASGASDYSNVAIIEARLATPTSLTVIATSNPSRLNLQWIDNAIGEDAYWVERSTSSVFPTLLTATTSLTANSIAYTDSNISEGVIYYYRVTASNSGSYSYYSSIASGKTTPSLPGVPTAPILGSFYTNSTTTPRTIKVKWFDTATNETGFTLERSTASTTGYSAVAYNLPPYYLGNISATCSFSNYPCQSYKDTTVADGVQYFYRMKADNQYGSSVYSKVASSIIPISLPLAPVSGIIYVNATTTPYFVRVNWFDQATNETSFILERSIASTTGFGIISQNLPAYNENPNATCSLIYPQYPRYACQSYKDFNVNYGDTFFYRIKAKNQYGESAYSHVMPASIVRETVPPALSIQSPIFGNSYATTSSPLGHVNLYVTDNIVVTSVLWSNSTTGQSGSTYAGNFANTHVTPKVNLVAGENILVFKAYDGSGNSTSVTLVVNYVVPSSIEPQSIPPSVTPPPVFPIPQTPPPAPASITVTYPTAGSSIYRAAPSSIIWNSSGIVGNVKIDLIKNGAVYRTLATSVPNTGSYSWTPNQVTPAIVTGLTAQYSIMITGSTLPGTAVTGSSGQFVVTGQTAFDYAEPQVAGAYSEAPLVATLTASRPDLGVENASDIVALPNAGSVTLSWNAPDATVCAISGSNFGLLPATGSHQTDIIRSNQTFTLTCSDGDRVVSDSVFVSIKHWQ